MGRVASEEREGEEGMADWLSERGEGGEGVGRSEMGRFGVDEKGWEGWGDERVHRYATDGQL